MRNGLRRRTYSAPVKRERKGHRTYEDLVASSSRRLFDDAAVSPRGDGEKVRWSVPDPKANCRDWLRHWANERSVNWATDYFATREWTLSDFVLPRWEDDEGAVQLGAGGDGVVWFAVEKEHKIPCALKELYTDTEREILIHATLEHSSITRFYTDFYDATRDSHFIVLEFCAGGSLFDLLPDEGGVPEDMAAYAVSQIVSSLSYLHSLGVVYADLKTTNVMLDAYGRLKLSDFGASHWAAGVKRKLRNVTGTVDTQPPEMMGEIPGFDKHVDNWSLGVLTYRLLVGGYPFSFEDDDEVIRRNILTLSYTIPEYISSKGRDVIAGLLKVDPGERLSLEAVKSHPWLQGVEQPADFVTRAALEVDAYHTSLNFDDLKPAEPVDSSLLARTVRFCDVPITKQNFILSLLVVYLLGCVTGINLQKAAHLGALYYNGHIRRARIKGNMSITSMVLLPWVTPHPDLDSLFRGWAVEWGWVAYLNVVFGSSGVGR